METQRFQETTQTRDKSYQGMKRLVSTVQKLSYSRTIDTVVSIVKQAARQLTGADGASFILRETDQCYYVDEDAIGPLWKGKRFPMEACVSGWSMINKQEAIIKDIYQDSRVPADAYRPTFVKSLVMVPIRKENPIGAIGIYWATPRAPESYEVDLLQSLADSTSISIENIQLYQNLQTSLTDARAARDEIARQLNLRDEFISVAAHELKTPLTPVIIQTQFLEKLLTAQKFKGHPYEDKLVNFSQILRRQMRDLSKLIENLLDSSRIRLNQFTLERVPNVDLSELIRTLVEQYQPITESQLVTVLDPPLLGYWDPVRLGQLLQNLISNAISYGMGKPIFIRALSQDSKIRITIEDHGIGISKKDQERIFDRFERATSLKSFGGMGLGLYISKEIVRAHGGILQTQSELGQGSTFIIELPTQPDTRL